MWIEIKLPQIKLLKKIYIGTTQGIMDLKN
jgi:hypothetical protein